MFAIRLGDMYLSEYKTGQSPVWSTGGAGFALSFGSFAFAYEIVRILSMKGYKAEVANVN